MKDGGPIAGALLAEEAHGGVPGGIGAIEKPPPVGDEGEGDPDGDAEGTGEMGDGGVGGDDKVEIHHDRSRIGKRSIDRIDVGAWIDDWQYRAETRKLLGAGSLLEADEANSGNLPSKFSKEVEGNIAS